MDNTAMPRIALVGPSGSGKDEAGSYLGKITHLRYVGALSWIGRQHAMAALGIATETEYQQTRHARRQELKDFFDMYRKDDPLRLIKDSLALGEIVVGIRDKLEIEAAKQAKLFHSILWIDNPHVPPDPTLTYTADDCVAVMRNDGYLADFHAALGTWAHRLGLPMRGLLPPL